MITIEHMMTLAAIARETERIGLVATGSTTFNEPFKIARQFKALDVMSHGRVGWNAVTTSDPAATANYGCRLRLGHSVTSVLTRPFRSLRPYGGVGSGMPG
jgi:alkanesulfonate monooxygenase SsuD/methylene tetrahydromethanopterin reductase-like flavin-dependent oxidoreductase (luciferase family)